MPDYSQGKIYCIRAPGTDDVYIGSTTQPLWARMAEHRSHYKRWKDGKRRSCTSCKLLEKEGAYIELIEEYPCDNKEQLNRREGEIVRASPSCVNKYVPQRTPKEYRKDRRDDINYVMRERERSREYYWKKKQDTIDATRSTGAETEMGASAETSTIVEPRHE